jgi:hypothetical protein
MNRFLTQKDREYIGRYSQEAARFFRVPFIDFEVRERKYVPSGETVSDSRMNDKLAKFFGPSVTLGAFYPEGSRRIIELVPKTLRLEVIRHEIAHGYHYSYNDSFSALYEATQRNNQALVQMIQGRFLRYQELMPQLSAECFPNLDLHKTAEENRLIVNWINQEIAMWISTELVARIYSSYKQNGNHCQNVRISVPRDQVAVLRKDLTKIEIDFLNSQNIGDNLSDIILLREIVFRKLYSEFVPLVVGSFFGDSKTLPYVQITPKEEDKESLQITLHYKPLSTEDIETKIRAVFQEDCTYLTRRLIAELQRQNDHIAKEATKWHPGH